MMYTESFKRVKELCRVCTNYSIEVRYFHERISPFGESPSILQVLEDLFSVKVIDDDHYPRIVCTSCCERLRLFHEFKNIYQKSQIILGKYVSLLSSIPLDKEQKESFDHLEARENKIANGYQESLTECDVGATSDNEDIPKSEPSDKSRERDQEITDITNRTTMGFKSGRWNGHSIDRSALKCVKCTNCYKRFWNIGKLREHKKSCENNGTFECDFCTERFETKKKKNAHINYKHKKREYKCEDCNAVFHSAGKIWYHKMRVHVNNIYKCDKCGKIFNMKNSFRKHLDTHNKGTAKVVCAVCGKSFHYESGLFYHMRVHQNIRNYKCTYCPKPFLTMSGLKRHLRTHTGERPYYCSFCAKSFSSLTEIKTHEMTHTGEQPHVCMYCNNSYLSLYNMKVHMSTHAGSCPCDLCDRSFLNPHVLQLHRKFKHSESYKQEKDDQVKEILKQ